MRAAAEAAEVAEAVAAGLFFSPARAKHRRPSYRPRLVPLPQKQQSHQQYGAREVIIPDVYAICLPHVLQQCVNDAVMRAVGCDVCQDMQQILVKFLGR